ncbi:MAG: hypothetical protein DRP92_01350 [Candidatus Neomarinimicrobiota bacterium]|nr:MAG: hypothetical protein DRP92_01350 [Candidatus Neomarinimicrobiota bacterium]
MDGGIILTSIAVLSVAVTVSVCLNKATNSRVDDCEASISEIRQCINEIKSMISDMRVEIVTSVSKLSERIGRLEERVDGGKK